MGLAQPRAPPNAGFSPRARARPKGPADAEHFRPGRLCGEGLANSYSILSASP